MHKKLEVDVYGHWSDNPPIYRIYVNEEMLTERTFVWPSYQNYIREHMYCDLDTGVHTLRLEHLDSSSRFELEHFTVDNDPVNKNLLKSHGSQIEWKFIVDNLLNNHESKKDNPTAGPAAISQIEVLTPLSERPRKVIQVKNYDTYIPLVQRTRQLNAKK